MAPEKLLGGEYSVQSDVWSFGLSLVELVVGRYPIPAPTRRTFAHEFGVPVEDIDMDDVVRDDDLAGAEGPSTMATFEFLWCIVNDPPPVLPRKLFTDEFRQFVGKCLKKNATERANHTTLMKEPFFLEHETNDDTATFAAWVIFQVSEMSRTLRPSLIFAAALCASLFVAVGATRKLKVLVNNPTLGYSHVQFQGRLADALVDAGHEVHVFMPQWNPNEHSNGTEKAQRVIKFQANTQTLYHEISMVKDPFNSGGTEFDENVYFAYLNLTEQYCKDQLSDPYLLDSLRAERYDVAISESFDVCAFGMFHALGIPTKLLSSAIPLPDMVAHLWGIPTPRSYVSIAFMGNVDAPRYSYWQRAKLLFLHMLTSHGTFNRYYPQMQQCFTDRFGPQFPELWQILQNASYGFINTVDMLQHPQPISSKVINVGGIAIKKPKKLSSVMDSLLNASSKGAVLFSFGTFADPMLMPAHMVDTFLEAFSHFPEYTFIWKFKRGVNDTKFDRYTNVYTTQWLDQTSLLADPRVKAFVTHSGLNSITEAAFLGKPVIGVPLFADQHGNIALMLNRGAGLFVDPHTMTVTDVVDRLRRVLNEPSYSEAAMRLSKKLADAPFSPKERFVRFVEYAAAHKDEGELQLYGAYLNFFTYFCLDIIIPTLALTTLLLYLLLRTLRWVTRKTFSAMSSFSVKEKMQ
ncbi:Protein UGT-49 [Aphelenchoides avenae]|nr:Protein UGT-49 [Aphelenchus avenae]